MGEMKCSGQMDHDGPMRAPMSMMAREHYGPYRWVQGINAALALWLIAAPFALGYAKGPSVWSDIASGVAILVLATLALGRERGWASWSQAAVGVWLMFAPLLFWAPDAATYVNGTLVGGLIAAFGFVIPMAMEMPGRAIPPGWTYNPSSWPQRIPIIFLGTVSFLIASWMALYQLGYIVTSPDPFFGDGTRRVLDSEISKMWPVSDAGLGAMTYLVEVLSTLMGDRRRWRTMPWMVAIFGAAVVPLGVVSIVLIVLQPLAVGAWCTPCLITAALMLIMIPLSLDEVVAMVQFVRRRKKEGASAWNVFWLGDHMPEPAGERADPRASAWSLRGMIGGVTGPVGLYAAAALGVWLMFAPDVLGSTGAMADSDHLVGAIVVVIAVIALAEAGRPVRFLNLLCAAWLVSGPWLLDGGSTTAKVNTALAGVLIALFSLPLGKIRDGYGSYDRWVSWSPFGGRTLRRVEVR